MKHSLILNAKAIAQTALFVAPRSDVRYYLHGINIQPGKRGPLCAGTNGHLLALARSPDGGVIDDTGIVTPNHRFDPIILEVSPELLKACRAKAADLVRIDSLPNDHEAVLVAVTYTDRPKASKMICNLIEARSYPDVLRIMSEYDEESPATMEGVALAPAYMDLFKKVFAKSSYVRLSAVDKDQRKGKNKDTSRVIVTCCGEPNFIGVWMAVRENGEGPSLNPDWLRSQADDLVDS